LWLKVFEDLTPHILWALLNQMIRVLFDQIAGIVDDAFEEVKEIQEVLVAGDTLRVCLLSLFLSFLLWLRVGLFSCLAFLLK